MVACGSVLNSLTNLCKYYGRASSSKWRVMVSGELMFLESYGKCDVTITVTLLL